LCFSTTKEVYYACVLEPEVSSFMTFKPHQMLFG